MQLSRSTTREASKSSEGRHRSKHLYPNTTDDLQGFGISVDIKPCSSILKGYGGNPMKNLGTTNLKVAYKNTSISTKFIIVEAPGHPSMIGCQQAQERGIITIKVEEVSNFSARRAAKYTVQHVGLSKATVLNEYIRTVSTKSAGSLGISITLSSSTIRHQSYTHHEQCLFTSYHSTKLS